MPKKSAKKTNPKVAAKESATPGKTQEAESTKPKRIGAAAKWVPPADKEIITISNDQLLAFRKSAEAESAIFGELFKKQDLGLFAHSNRARDLHRFALDGWAYAIKELWRIAEEATQLLTDIAERKPELVRPIAENLGVWPVLSGPLSKTRKRNEALFAEIALGSKVDMSRQPHDMGLVTTSRKLWAWLLITAVRAICAGVQEMTEIIDFLRDEGKTREDLMAHYGLEFFRKTVATNIKVWLFDSFKVSTRLLRLCADLRPLCADEGVIQAWWIAAHELLMLNTCGKPEDVPALRDIGHSREPHDSGEVKQAAGTEGTVNLSGSTFSRKSMDANIRAKIFTDLREELVSFAEQEKKLAPEQ
jgi:hypothetical protein